MEQEPSLLSRIVLNGALIGAFFWTTGYMDACANRNYARRQERIARATAACMSAAHGSTAAQVRCLPDQGEED